jgi:hypothetical protein
MNEQTSGSTRGLSVIYFLLSLFAPWPLAWELAQARVHAAGVSNFEGKSGFAAVMQTPAWAMLLMLGIWVAYLFIRRSVALLWLATFALVIPSLALVGHVVALLR